MMRMVLSVIYFILLSFSSASLHAVFDQKSLDQSFVIGNSEDVASLFPETIEEIESGFQFVKNRVNTLIEELLYASLKNPTFENTVLQYDQALAYFERYGSVIATLQMLHPDKDLCLKAEETLKAWTDIKIDLFVTNKDIYRSFKEFQYKNYEILNPERKYYLLNAIADFQRAGLELDEQQFLEIKQLQKEIARLSIQFQTNVAQDILNVHVTRDCLSGISNDFVNSLPKDGDNYILGCDKPTYSQVMHNCSVENTRKTYLHTSCKRGFPKNTAILSEIIDNRDKLAALLGYSSYTEFDIAPEMAKTPEIVEKFLNELSLKTRSKIKSNWDIIKYELPSSVVLTEDGKIKSWDVAYVANQYIKAHFDINNDKIAEYFPMERTIRNLLGVYEQFFDIQFKVVNGGHYWDSTVQTIEVRNRGSDGSLIGYVLLDLFPRERKFGHCCCNSIIPPVNLNGPQQVVPALAVVIANFSKPTAERPSLLKHHEVVTFFHEFGHAIHALLGRAEMPTKAAYNTKIDFIEMPSQLLEEWMWDEEILKMISHHYLTGNPLPDSTIKDLIKCRSFTDGAHPTTGGNSDHVGTELQFAKLSFVLFQQGQNKDIMKILKEIDLTSPQIVAYDPDLHYICKSGHLISYGAKYYSYPWSKQFALKIFNYIKSHGGLLSSEMGNRYRSKIIGYGGSRDPNLLMDDFFQTELGF